jgi:hypothetical protein
LLDRKYEDSKRLAEAKSQLDIAMVENHAKVVVQLLASGKSPEEIEVFLDRLLPVPK